MKGAWVTWVASLLCPAPISSAVKWRGGSSLAYGWHKWLGFVTAHAFIHSLIISHPDISLEDDCAGLSVRSPHWCLWDIDISSLSYSSVLLYHLQNKSQIA